MEGKEPLLLVLITAPDLETARGLARALVSRKIAACANLTPGLVSIYSWEESLHEDEEILLMIKTRQGLLESHLIPLIHELHPYDLPEIIALPLVGGSQDYLNWIREETEGDI